jgi:tRNA(Ile)-lysidine synthetase-like protein
VNLINPNDFNFLKNKLEVKLKTINHFKILLAYSGGPDSTLCLLLLLSLKNKLNLNLGIIIINHKQNIKNFFQEESYIINLCKLYKIPLFIQRLSEDLNKFAINQNFFRQYRLEAIITTAHINQYPLVITGHNMEDQVDTFFMRIGKGSGLYGLASIQNSTINYGINFHRPLLETSREIIEQLMKNYGYFLDGSRHWNFQRNTIRKLHKSMESAGINLSHIQLSINKIQSYLTMTKDLHPSVEKGYNYYLINDLPQEQSLLFHCLYHGIKHINPALSMDLQNVENILNNKSYTNYNCWFIKKKNNLLITSQPIPNKNNIEITIAPHKSHFYNKKFWIYNNTHHNITVMTIDKWCKNFRISNYFSHTHSETIASMIIIGVDDHWIVDNSLTFNHEKYLNKFQNNIFIQHQDFNKFFITISFQ